MSFSCVGYFIAGFVADLHLQVDCFNPCYHFQMEVMDLYPFP